MAFEKTKKLFKTLFRRNKKDPQTKNEPIKNESDFRLKGSFAFGDKALFVFHDEKNKYVISTENVGYR